MKIYVVVVSNICFFLFMSAHKNEYVDIENARLNNSSWRQIQHDVKDCVVQIFAQRAAVNILLPWAPPEQHPARGSGFFFNENGEILTNAHVVDQALAVWIQIPSMGKRLVEVSVVGVCPERDVALLRIVDNEIAGVKNCLGTIPYLELGDSDTAYRTDEVLALGYPLGQESLKSTIGVISGGQQQWIQMDTPINPGSSGGPLLNKQGKVIGINAAGYTDAQNVGYVIPINNIKVMLAELYKKRLLYKPSLGIFFTNVTNEVTDYLGNPQPGGCYVAEVAKNSSLYNAGVRAGDMIYEIDGYRLDIYGEMNVSWSEDKISIIDYVSRIELGQEVPLVVYRKGERLVISISFDQSDRLPIRVVYPGYETLDYEIFAGMVVMELTLNHIRVLSQYAPALSYYNEMKNQNESMLVVTHIFSSSQLYRARTISPGATLVEVNEQPVKTLNDFRQAIQKDVSGYFVVKASDRVSNITDNLLVVLSYESVLQEELKLAQQYHYPISNTVKKLLKNSCKLQSF